PLYVLYNFFFAISFAVCLYFCTILHIEYHVHGRFRPLYFTVFRRLFLHILHCIYGNLFSSFFFLHHLSLTFCIIILSPFFYYLYSIIFSQFLSSSSHIYGYL